MLRGKVNSVIGHFWRVVGGRAARGRKERGGDGRNGDNPFLRCLVTPRGLGRFFPKDERSITKFLEVSLFHPVCGAQRICNTRNGAFGAENSS